MYYLDTSALAKLVVEEPETQALMEFIDQAETEALVTSALTRAELLRVAKRRDEHAVDGARRVLDGVAQITLTTGLLDRAGTLDPPLLRTLDVIHLATALELGPDLVAFVAYDRRLLEAAQALEIPTLSPA